ncbi:MAG: NYN domain-containing protein [Candidatus Delongbacteria bacterium]|nr:NYN domain-containing protein [Candidatus Delongbacteria bacterium]
MNELKNEILGLKRRISDQQPLPRKLISRLRPSEIRLGLFVDVQNVFYGARQFNAKLDFDRLLAATINHRRLIRAFAYVVISSEVDQSGFLTMLQHKSFEVKSKNLRLRADGSAKANWDIEMTIDMLSLADKFDVIALVSGDGDFVPLVNILKTLGPIVEVYSFPHNTSKDLMESADRYMAIDKTWLILNEYEPLTNNSMRICK